MRSRLLIVDDNVFLIEILRRMLVDEGFEVSTEMNGQKGYSAYLLNQPHVVLTDIHMPGGDGIQLMRKIRKHDPGMPAIYMSGDWERLKSVAEGGEENACVRFLRKPFSPQELMKLIYECLQCGSRDFPQAPHRSSSIWPIATT
jgi:DNA-binding NtrC family response regulator